MAREYEAFVRLAEDDTGRAEGATRALVLQDYTRRTGEIAALHPGMGELENRLSGEKYGAFVRRKLSPEEKGIADLPDIGRDGDGEAVVARKRNAIPAKENACGRFAVATASKEPWLDLPVRCRPRDGAEYDFSQLRSDSHVGMTGESDQDSAEGGLPVNSLSLRLGSTLIDLLKEKGLAGKMRASDAPSTPKKLKISCIGGSWRLNEVAKAQRGIFEAFGINIR